jgi:radical SAM superfamily enzyme YgiQ (UPF0313 family)
MAFRGWNKRGYPKMDAGKISMKMFKKARVLIVSANREEINMTTWPLGPASVAAATQKAGHEVRLLDLMRLDDPKGSLKKAIIDFNPCIIGVSVRNIDDQRMQGTIFFLEEVKSLINLCKTLTSAPVVLGGAGYSIFPESALKYLGADMGIQGEGESAFPELVTRICSGSELTGPYLIHRAGFAPAGKRSYITALDNYPLPGIALVPSDSYTNKDFWMPVQTRRGCAMDCSYCSTPEIEGKPLRKRSSASVTAWLSECVKAGISRFFFVDNTFNIPESYAIELSSAIIKAGLHISWRSIIYPWKLDERLAELMAQAGCVEVSLGSESGSEYMLSSMNKRFTPDDVRRTSEAFARHGIRRMGFLMLGAPGETLESAEESLYFADSLNLEALKITIGIRIYPRTDLARRAVMEGVIGPDDDLLLPKFYIVKNLEHLLRKMVENMASARPNWLL